jgi:hypothetical protein
MIKKNNNCVAIEFDLAAGATGCVQGDVMEIVGDMQVCGPTGATSTKIIGDVATHSSGTSVATINTKYRVFRDDRLSAGVVTVGPMCLGVDNKVSSATGGTNPLAISGMAVSGATGAGLAVSTLEY